MKYCGFNGVKFEWSEFKNANMRGSRFKGAKFKNTLFYNTNLTKANFKDAKFKNTIFIGTSIKNAKGISKSTPGILFYNTLPKIKFDNVLISEINNSLKNEYISRSEVLFFQKHKRLNSVNIDRLLGIFTEEQLIKGLKMAYKELDRNFYTLSYLISFISKSV